MGLGGFFKPKNKIHKNMNNLVLELLIGLAAGLISVAFMMYRRQSRMVALAMFFHYFIVACVILHYPLPFKVEWWLQGGIISLIMIIPSVILNRKDPVLSLVFAAALGTLVSVVQYYL